LRFLRQQEVEIPAQLHHLYRVLLNAAKVTTVIQAIQVRIKREAARKLGNGAAGAQRFHRIFSWF
jgi:hypothetical protein